MEEFLPEPGRAKYWAFLPGSMESLTWLSEGWSITPCRCKGDGQHLCLSTLTPYLARCYDRLDHVYWSVIPNQ